MTWSAGWSAAKLAVTLGWLSGWQSGWQWAGYSGKLSGWMLVECCVVKAIWVGKQSGTNRRIFSLSEDFLTHLHLL